jgi:hypothetical protein
VSKAFSKSINSKRPSVSQRQGLITCIPKEGKPKHFLKNWRPITLLNVDFKIASACIANRIKPILRNIISETQKGFLNSTVKPSIPGDLKLFIFFKEKRHS